MTAETGRFIVFEGIDGCGKSTQAHLLAEALKARGVAVTLTREPGGTATGERIRDMLLAQTEGRRNPLTDLYLFSAARAQHMREVILPALSRGETVICDRFIDSTYAYQTAGQGVDVTLFARIAEPALCGRFPDAVFVIDVPPAVARERLLSGGKNGAEAYYESLGEAFFINARAAFLRRAKEETRAAYHVIDGTDVADVIHQKILYHNVSV